MTAAKLTLRTILFLFCLAVSVSTVHAQFKASIQGTVLDPEGNAIAGCKVQVVEQSTGLTRETVTSDQGFYRIAELPPGQYTVTVEAPGFNKSVSKDVAFESVGSA